MSNKNYSRIELKLKNGELETTAEFCGILIGKSVFIDKEQECLPQELIKVFKRKDGKYVSYMGYFDR